MVSSPAEPQTCPTNSLPAIIPITKDDTQRFERKCHSHTMDQLIYAVSGIASVTTDAGTWVTPPNRAVWIPQHTEHATCSFGPVKFRGLFVPAGAGTNMPMKCSVIAVSPLLRELLLRAAESDPESRSIRYWEHLSWLLLQELKSVPMLPLYLPAPQRAALARVCAQLQSDPTLELGLNEVSSQLGMTRRTFMRHFRADTGMTFGRWRQHARIMASLPMLASGRSVLNVALDCGYQSPSAFSAMFRRILGMAPRDYFQ
jgi:AraC-like DNA-binding protein